MRILAFTTSLSRLVFVNNNIKNMIGQTHDVTYAVNIRNVNEQNLQEYVISQYQKEIDEGKLFIRSAGNHTQTVNMLRVFDGLNIDNYDLFVRIDDDDIYINGYIHNLIEWYARHTDGVNIPDISWTTPKYKVYISKKSDGKICENDMPKRGNTIVMSRKYVKKLLSTPVSEIGEGDDAFITYAEKNNLSSVKREVSEYIIYNRHEANSFFN